MIYNARTEQINACGRRGSGGCAPLNSDDVRLPARGDNPGNRPAKAIEASLRPALAARAEFAVKGSVH